MNSTTVRNDLKVDTLFKDYFVDHSHFADMVNATLFHGQQVIYPHMISEYDSSVSTYYEDNKPKTLERDRDSLKKVTIGHQAILIGIENQGQEKWNGPRTYDEAVHPIPAVFEDIAKYNMYPITDIVALDYQLFRNQDNRDMVKGLQMLYKWKGDLEVFRGMKMRKIVALIIAAHANNEELLKIVSQQEKEEDVDMCESMRLYTEKILAEGENKGERIGIIDLLNYKFGKLSPEVVEQIKGSSTEQLNQLKMKIFNIESEKDIVDAMTC